MKGNILQDRSLKAILEYITSKRDHIFLFSGEKPGKDEWILTRGLQELELGVYLDGQDEVSPLAVLAAAFSLDPEMPSGSETRRNTHHQPFRLIFQLVGDLFFYTGHRLGGGDGDFKIQVQALIAIFPGFAKELSSRIFG